MATEVKQLVKKWSPILEASEVPAIGNEYKKGVIAQVLENTEKALREERSHSQFMVEAPTNNTGSGTGDGGINNWDPIMISLVRRSMPNLIAYDIAGVQPMTGPTGLIFAMKSRYKDDADRLASTEAFYQEALTDFSSNSIDSTDLSPGVVTGTAHGGNPSGVTGGANVADPFYDAGYGFGSGMTTMEGETLGNGRDNDFNEMSFTIERATVTARTRALKAEYTMEMAQDLKAIHGLDAEAELATILSTEILAEINREMIRTINSRAKLGCQQVDIAAPGIFDLDVDSDGRWSVEKYKGMIVQLYREANVIARETRRGKGNFVLCSSDVAAALSATGMLDYAPQIAGNASLTNLVLDTGNTFVGTLSTGMKVYVDPYANVNYLTLGYRGSNPYDAGIFYCPYVPLTMVRAVGENTFQPKIGFKTRYGMVANPYVGSPGSTPQDNIGTARGNEYYRIFRVDNILGEGNS
jgi:hypothetical protein